MSKAKLTTFSQQNIGFIFAIASAALFAIRPIFVKLVYMEGVDPTTLIALRMLFSAPIYIALLIYFLRMPEMQGRLTSGKVFKISLIGLFGYYAASYLDLVGLQYLTAQLGRMILYTYPTFVVLLGAVFFGKRITLQILISLIVTYLGIALIFGHDLNQFGSDVITGALYIVASALCFALYLLLGKPLIDDVGPRLFTCVALISASFGIFAHFSITHSLAGAELNTTATLLILVIAIFCTVIPTFFTTAAVARIGADRTGIVATIGPAFTSASAVLMLNESFTIYHFLGISITILGIWYLQRKPETPQT